MLQLSIENPRKMKEELKRLKNIEFRNFATVWKFCKFQPVKMQSRHILIIRDLSLVHKRSWNKCCCSCEFCFKCSRYILLLSFTGISWTITSICFIWSYFTALTRVCGILGIRAGNGVNLRAFFFSYPVNVTIAMLSGYN